MVSVIDESGDAQNGQVTNEISVGYIPDAIAVDPASHSVYVADAVGYDRDGTVGTVSLIDANTGTVTAAIQVGHDPTGIAVDPMGWWAWPTPSHNIFITNESEPGTVSVISCSYASMIPSRWYSR